MIRRYLFGLLAALLALPIVAGQSQTSQDAYLSWSSQQAEEVGRSARMDGRVGGRFDMRVIRTERSYNYKLRATWLTPEVIRATARLEQLRMHLDDEKTRWLVAEAEAAGQTVILIEIDPREGSGVIPLDWRAILQPKDWKPGMPGAVVGVSRPELKNTKALAGVFRRDYSYDLFWVVFPLIDERGMPTLPDSTREVELLVGIYDKKGTVSWPIPDSIRIRARSLSQTKQGDDCGTLVATSLETIWNE